MPLRRFILFILLCILLSVAYASRLYIMQDVGMVMFHGDEAMLSKTALDVFTTSLEQNDWHFFGFTLGTVAYFPTLWYYLQGAVIYFLGPAVWTTKVFALITDYGIAVLVGIFGARWRGTWFGIAAGAIYATLPAAIHFGMTGYQNIQSTFFLMATIVLLQRALDDVQKPNKSPRFLIFLAGLAAGAGMYFYLSSYLTPLIAICIIIFKKSPIRQMVRHIATFITGYGITALPFFLNAIAGGFLFGARQEVFTTDKILTNLFTTARSFWDYPFNGSGAHYIAQPLLVHWTLVALMVFGVIMSIRQWAQKDISSALTLLVFVLTLVFGTIFTETPVASQRVLHILPITALLMTLGIHTLGEMFIKHPRVQQGILVGAVGWVCMIQLHAYATKNIPTYQSLPREEYAIVTYLLMDNEYTNSPIISFMPVHKVPLVYFYSEGQLSPILWELAKDELPESFMYISTPGGLDVVPKKYDLVLLDYTYDSPEDIQLYQATNRSEP